MTRALLVAVVVLAGCGGDRAGVVEPAAIRAARAAARGTDGYLWVEHRHRSVAALRVRYAVDGRTVGVVAEAPPGAPIPARLRVHAAPIRPGAHVVSAHVRYQSALPCPYCYPWVLHARVRRRIHVAAGSGTAVLLTTSPPGPFGERGAEHLRTTVDARRVSLSAR